MGPCSHQQLRRLKSTSAPTRFTNGTNRQLRGKKVVLFLPAKILHGGLQYSLSREWLSTQDIEQGGGSPSGFWSLFQRLPLSLAFCEKIAYKMKCPYSCICPSAPDWWITLNTSTNFNQIWQCNRSLHNKKFLQFNGKGDREEEQDLSSAPLCRRM